MSVDWIDPPKSSAGLRNISSFLSCAAFRRDLASASSAGSGLSLCARSSSSSSKISSIDCSASSPSLEPPILFRSSSSRFPSSTRRLTFHFSVSALTSLTSGVSLTGISSVSQISGFPFSFRFMFKIFRVSIATSYDLTIKACCSWNCLSFWNESISVSFCSDKTVA